jgi:hypothetical protein
VLVRFPRGRRVSEPSEVVSAAPERAECRAGTRDAS